jgi:hypothetical protein
MSGIVQTKNATQIASGNYEDAINAAKKRNILSFKDAFNMLDANDAFIASSKNADLNKYNISVLRKSFDMLDSAKDALSNLSQIATAQPEGPNNGYSKNQIDDFISNLNTFIKAVNASGLYDPRAIDLLTLPDFNLSFDNAESFYVGPESLPYNLAFGNDHIFQVPQIEGVFEAVFLMKSNPMGVREDIMQKTQEALNYITKNVLGVLAVAIEAEENSLNKYESSQAFQAGKIKTLQPDEITLSKSVNEAKQAYDMALAVESSVYEKR